MTKVLIADDQAQNRYMIEVLLRGHGYEVISASNGAEALKFASENPPDLIVTDILMPVMDGFALCRQWRAHESLKEIPFIFYTATYTEPKDEQFALELGADRYIIKPAEPSVLTRAIEEVLENCRDRNLAPSRPLGAEMEFFRQHNEALFHKLEHKMAMLKREISERKRAEVEIERINAGLEARILERTCELSVANRELESFAYSVSHDLRAPLRRIDGWSHILLEDYGGSLDETARDYLRTIRAEAQHMAELIEAMLQLSRVIRGELSKGPVDMAQVARGLEKDLRQAEPERDVEFVVSGDLGSVYADSRLVRALLQNLLGNAWKFTGKIQRAHVELGITTREGQRAFYVRDDGAGFDTKYAGKLFQPFQRLHDSDEFPGLGVGLATARRIIQRHGGKIWAEGEAGKGATFYFTLEGGEEGKVRSEE